MEKSILTDDKVEVGHKSTPDSIARFAGLYNHKILYDCWIMYQKNEIIRWGEAMQLAAIHLSVRLKEVEEELFKYRLRYGEEK